MKLTPDQEQLGKENFNESVAVTRRQFLKGAAAAVPTLGAAYFGYGAIQGSPLKVGFIGTGDEGSVLLTQHPPEYMDIVAIADLRAKNRDRALTGDGNEVRWGLIRKLGRDTALKIKRYADHKELLAKHPEIEAVGDEQVAGGVECQVVRVIETRIGGRPTIAREFRVAGSRKSRD